MATNGVNGTSHKPDLQWKVGLINYNGKYLTAESFGYKINVSGTSLKKKQTFILEQDPSEEVVYIRSHTNCYMSSDKYGNVTCEAEERGESEKFAVEYDNKHGSGKWAFKNVAHGNYLGGNEEKFKCFSKAIDEQELWIVQLSIHPQVNVRNVNRKRYAHLKDEELQVTEVTPWGPEALVILHFDNGKYALRTVDGHYLNRDGTLSKDLTDDNKYILEMRSKPHPGLAFKDKEGFYLTAVGASATMKGRNKTISKDELFAVEDPFPQVVLTYVCNKKKVSTRQGVDVTANQDEPEDTDREIFQMDLVVPATEDKPAKWAFRTVDNTYWVQEQFKRLQATCKDCLNPNCQFEVEWLGDGTIAMKANSGDYVQGTQTGQLAGVSNTVTEKEKFIVRIVNRPQLVLKNEHGFVGLKSAQKAEVQSSKTHFDLIYLEANDEGKYFLKGSNGKYWSVQGDGSILADGDNGVPFILEPRGACTVCIKAPNGKYIKGEHNGTFKAVGEEVDASMLWEF